MAYTLQDTRTISLAQGEDLSSAQFQFVKLGTDGTVRVCDKLSAPLGILENTPSAGVTGTNGSYQPGQYYATVSVDGVTRIAVDGAYSAGTLLVPSASTPGYGSSIDNASTSWLYARAISLQASTTGGDIIGCRLIGPVGATGFNG